MSKLIIFGGSMEADDSHCWCIYLVFWHCNCNFTKQDLPMS